MLVQQENSKKKGHYSRPVPRSFAAAWESNKEGAPRRPRSRTPSPPRDRFDEPPPPWHKEREDRLLPRFHPGPPPHDPGRHPTDYPPEDMRPADIPHHMDPALPPDVHPHAMEPRTFAREGEPEFVPGVTSEVPYRGADPGPRGIRGVDPGPRGLRGAEPAPRGVPEERREFHEPPEMAVDPEEHDLIVEYPGPDNHVNKRDHARGPVRNRPPPDDYPRMQSDHPGPLKEYPGMGDRGNNLNNWTKEIDREALLREDQFYADLYNRNLDPAFDEMADDQPMAYDIVDHPLPFRGPERGMPRGRPRAMRRGRVMPLRGRGWRGGGPWNPGDGPARGRPPPGMRPPMRMRRGRRVMIDWQPLVAAAREISSSRFFNALLRRRKRVVFPLWDRSRMWRHEDTTCPRRRCCCWKNRLIFVRLLCSRLGGRCHNAMVVNISKAIKKPHETQRWRVRAMRASQVAVVVFWSVAAERHRF